MTATQTPAPHTVILDAVSARPGSTAQEILESARKILPALCIGSVVGMLSTAVTRGQVRTEGEPEVRRYFPVSAAQTPSSPANRVWTVRAGVTGSGMDLFHVYAPTMDTARASVEQIARETPLVDKLTWDGFTVHAGVPVAGLTLREAPVAVVLPALDVPTLGLAA